MAKSILNRFLPFILGLACGIAATLPFNDPIVSHDGTLPDPGFSEKARGPGQSNGTGSSGGSRPDGLGELERGHGVRAGTNGVNYIAKPRALYTDEARANEIQGSVLLKVTLLASGQVGSISVIRGLPYGLKEQAIAAARKIRFEPATVDGRPISKVVTIDYSFAIY